MNKKTVIVSAALVVLAVALAAHLAVSEGTLLTRALGKAAWFLPYAAGLAAVRALGFLR